MNSPPITFSAVNFGTSNESPNIKELKRFSGLTTVVARHIKDEEIKSLPTAKKSLLEGGVFTSAHSARNLIQHLDVVCQVQAKVPGTGFLIGPGLLLTNHHIIPDKEWAKKAEVRFFYEEDKDPTEQVTVKCNVDDENQFFYTSPSPDNSGHEPLREGALDFTIVALEPHAKLDMIYKKGLSLFSDAKIDGDANLIQHPVMEDNRTKFKQVALNKIKDIGEHPPYEVHYETLTLPGSSGSPVLNADGKVFGLHRAECKFETHKDCNRAILISSIVDEICRAKLKEAIENRTCFFTLGSNLASTADKLAVEAERLLNELKKDPKKILKAKEALVQALKKYELLEKWVKGDQIAARQDKIVALNWQLQKLNLQLVLEKALLIKDRTESIEVDYLITVLDARPLTQEILNDPIIKQILQEEEKNPAHSFVSAFIYETLNDSKAIDAYINLGRLYLREDPKPGKKIDYCIKKSLSLDTKDNLKAKNQLLREAFKEILKSIPVNAPPSCTIFYDHDSSTEDWLERNLYEDLSRTLNWQKLYYPKLSRLGAPVLSQAVENINADFIFIICTPKLFQKNDLFVKEKIPTVTGRVRNLLAQRLLQDEGNRQYSIFPILIEGTWNTSNLDITHAAQSDFLIARTDIDYYRCALRCVHQIAEIMNNKASGSEEAKKNLSLRDLLNEFKNTRREIFLGLKQQIEKKTLNF